jgi:acyl carrier protein
MGSQIESVADIEATLLKLIKRSGVEDGPTCLIAVETIPYRDVDGFDSLTALEVLTELEEETGIHVEEDVFYLDTKPRKYLPIRGIALAIWNEIQNGGKTYARGI